MIRAAHTGDIGPIMDLWNAIIRDTTVTFTTIQKTEADIAALLSGPYPCLVVETEAGFAGFATLSSFRSGPGYREVAEHSIYLTEGARGQGLAAPLLDALCGAATAQGLRVLIAAISGDNARAVAFHTAQGFEKVGHLPGIGIKMGRQLDVIFMQKNL